MSRYLYPPPLSDKLADWSALAAFGGEVFYAGKDVLDVGPAYGLDAMMMAPKARRYVVADSDEYVLEHVRALHTGANTVCFDATRPWPLVETFNTVLDFSTFDDTSDPLACYREAFRVLRPGGCLISSFANARHAPPWVPGLPTTQDPDQLGQFVASLGFSEFRLIHEEFPRATILARRPT